jgi:transcriptional regulator with XRE-family HTH domain
MTDFRADDWQPKPYGVADRLREAREAAGLQQKDVAAALKWDPAKLSKTESGARTPTAADIRAWAEVTGLSDEKRDEALDLLERFRSRERSWRERMRHGRRSVQLEYERLYRDSTRFRIFQTVWVPGILQTPDYARQIFIDLDELDLDTPRDIDSDVQARMKRRDYLYDLGKQFEVIITESVMRTLIVDPPVMRSQLQRLESVMDLANVRFGIIPQGVRIHTAPQNSFVIYDELAVTENFVTDTPYHGEEASRMAVAMDRLWSDAAEGDRARALIRSAIEDLSAA